MAISQPESLTHPPPAQDLQTRIAALTQRHQLSNASRLQRASALQTQLTHRVLKLVQHLHLLIPALRSSALRPEEEALRAALEEIDEEVRRPGGAGGAVELIGPPPGSATSLTAMCQMCSPCSLCSLCLL